MEASDHWTTHADVDGDMLCLAPSADGKMTGARSMERRRMLRSETIAAKRSPSASRRTMHSV